MILAVFEHVLRRLLVITFTSFMALLGWLPVNGILFSFVVTFRLNHFHLSRITLAVLHCWILVSLLSEFFWASNWWWSTAWSWVYLVSFPWDFVSWLNLVSFLLSSIKETYCTDNSKCTVATPSVHQQSHWPRWLCAYPKQCESVWTWLNGVVRLFSFRWCSSSSRSMLCSWR